MKRGLFWLAFGSATAVTTLFCWAAWTFMILPMDNAVKAANKMERIFSEKFPITPRILANAGVLFSQTAHAENLVTATREVLVELPIDMPLEDGSQPRVRADFRLEAGIAGRDPIDMNIRRGGQEADAVFPKAKILTLELKQTPTVLGEGRNWGALPERIQIRMLRQLRLSARKQVLDSGLLAEADREFRFRLQNLASEAECVLVFEPPKAP
jgi:hypothetical protein